MEVFDFPYHTVEGENPETGTTIQFGSSYTFTTPSSDPDQRIFTLHFPIMKYFVDEETDLVNSEVNPWLNMKKMLDFYYEHRLHKSFQYNHPVHGIMEVRFHKPLPEPKGIPGGNGATEGFEVKLIEVP